MLINLCEDPSEVFYLNVEDVTDEILDSMKGYVSEKFLKKIKKSLKK